MKPKEQWLIHSEACAQFIKWASQAIPNAFVFPNRSGYASAEKVPYGIPPPPISGGSDYIAFLPGGITQFYEVKTYRYPTLSAKQRRFARNMTRQGFKCFVFFEDATGPVLWSEYQTPKI